MKSALDRSEMQREWRAHWPVPLVAAAAVTASLIHFGTLGVFLPAITAETGWSRSQITFGMMIYSIESILAAPFVGMLVDRFGPRRVGIPGLAIYLAAIALLGFTGPSIWTWWGTWSLLGIGGSLAKFNVWTTAVSRHFDKARGMAIAVALAGTSIAGIVMPLFATLALRYSDWRTGYLAIALLEGAIAMPLVLRWFADGQRAAPILAAGEAPTADRSAASSLRSPLFVSFAIVCLAAFMPVSGINVHLVPILREGGIAPDLAAVLAATTGAASLAGQASSGWLLDRFHGHLVFMAFLLSASMALVALLVGHSPGWGLLAAVAIGLFNGAGPACIAYLCSRHFDLRYYGTILSSLAGVMSLGAGLGSWAAGAIFDRFSSYSPLLIGAIPLLSVAILLNLAIGGSASNRAAVSR